MPCMAWTVRACLCCGLLGGWPDDQISIERARLFRCALLNNVRAKHMVNVGQLIKEELESQERTVTWLARKLNCTRATVYRIFEKNSLDTALLSTISKILNRDFFKELSEDVKIPLSENWYKSVSFMKQLKDKYLF